VSTSQWACHQWSVHFLLLDDSTLTVVLSDTNFYKVIADANINAFAGRWITSTLYWKSMSKELATTCQSNIPINGKFHVYQFSREHIDCPLRSISQAQKRQYVCYLQNEDTPCWSLSCTTCGQWEAVEDTLVIQELEQHYTTQSAQKKAHCSLTLWHHQDNSQNQEWFASCSLDHSMACHQVWHHDGNQKIGL
jgi:hypothetical protein